MKDMDSEAQIIQGTVLTMSKSELSYALCHFLLEVTNEKGDLYPRETLYALLMSLQMYCHSKGVYHKFQQDADFADVRNTLDNRIAHREKAEPFSLSEEEQM